MAPLAQIHSLKQVLQPISNRNKENYTKKLFGIGTTRIMILLLTLQRNEEKSNAHSCQLEKFNVANLMPCLCQTSLTKLFKQQNLSALKLLLTL